MGDPSHNTWGGKNNQWGNRNRSSKSNNNRGRSSGSSGGNKGGGGLSPFGAFVIGAIVFMAVLEPIGSGAAVAVSNVKDAVSSAFDITSKIDEASHKMSKREQKKFEKNVKKVKKVDIVDKVTDEVTGAFKDEIIDQLKGYLGKEIGEVVFMDYNYLNSPGDYEICAVPIIEEVHADKQKRITIVAVSPQYVDANSEMTRINGIISNKYGRTKDFYGKVKLSQLSGLDGGSRVAIVIQLSKRR